MEALVVFWTLSFSMFLLFVWISLAVMGCSDPELSGHGLARSELKFAYAHVPNFTLV
jgi:hypothetical protein